MGEAKRRKKLDPYFGLPKPKIIIEENKRLITIERKHGEQIITETLDSLVLGDEINSKWEKISIGTYIREINNPNEVNDTLEGLWIYTNEQDERTIYLTGKTADKALKEFLSSD